MVLLALAVGCGSDHIVGKTYQNTCVYPDADEDGYGDKDAEKECIAADTGEIPAGYSTNNTDCNDANNAISPGAEELCDEVDNNCNEVIDDNATDATTWYADEDHDGYGNPTITERTCERPDNFVLDNTDCDDTDPDINPETVWYEDVDEDGYGNVASTTMSCTQPDGFVADSTDCDDTTDSVNPGQREACNDDLDNDCDGDKERGPGIICFSSVGDIGAGATTNGITFIGEHLEDKAFGVFGAGDVDGDGYDDFGIGATHEDSGGTNTGAAYLIYGGSAMGSGAVSLTDIVDGTAAIAGAKFSGDSMSFRTGASASIGDTDNDGFSDLLVGANDYYDSTQSEYVGAAYLFNGSGTRYSNTISVSTGIRLTGDNSGDSTDATDGKDNAGHAVALTGDFDGDSNHDILISAYGNNNSAGAMDAGAAYLIYGPVLSNLDLADVGASIHGIKFEGEAAGDKAGISSIAFVNVDGDTNDDVLVGATYNDAGGTDAGAAYLFYGGSSSTGTELLENADVKFIGEDDYDSAGSALSNAGDVNGDGYGDILIGAYSNDNISGANAGVAYLVYGSTGGFSRDTIYLADIGATIDGVKFYGEASDDNAGVKLSSAGDINSDGCADFLIGAYNNGSVAEGATYLIYGEGSGCSGSGLLGVSEVDLGNVGDTSADPTKTVEGIKFVGEPNNYAGVTMSTAGDVDNDGYDDLLFGVYPPDGETDLDKSHLIFGGGLL